MSHLTCTVEGGIYTIATWKGDVLESKAVPLEKVVDMDGINVWGPPGVGKTLGACRLRNHGETLSITLSEDIVSQELMGHYIPRGNEFVWHDGPVTTAVREGYNVVVNELGRASAAVK